MNLFSLKGKRALVTGSSQGLGNAIAKGLGKAGAVIVLNGRKMEKLEKVKGAFEKEGIESHCCAFDVSDEAAVVSGVEEIEKKVGPIDILVNNAGINARFPVEDFPTEEWQRVLDTNINAVFFVSKAVGKKMIERGRGKIINTASLLSQAARPSIPAYAASKGAVRMLTKALAVEWAKYNIQVNAIGPGYFVTDLTRVLLEDEAFNAWVLDRTPAGRWGNPEDLMGTAVYLASDASNYVTGQVVYVDGGFLAAL